ncbi:uncharacterized protein LOC131941500 [Physella acuta]|uniref:uncharacterized protein LOC131941500 n=1 Tax=Physella acuta TaxID=109671 RepID=UPI0027DD39BB|nr:uncharacterized protein LOC131941500 [Physella acuta]
MAYVDELEPNVEALRDNSRSTYEVLNKLKVSWYAKYSFNWIRLVVSDTDQMNISSLHFFDNKDQLTIEKYSISKKDSTVDIHVALSKSAKRLEIEFVTDISLCTIFVSGGRNIALHMATTMSSTNDTNVASLAVDNEREMNSSDPTCTMTTDQDMSSPEWTVQFNSSVSIIGVIIYSKSPLSNLSVTIVRNQKTFKLSFNDILMKKDVVLLQLDKVVVAERLEITVQDSLLELCEVEIYGDETCESNKFGLLCDKPCDCRNKIKTCAIPTGACWSEFKGDFNDGCNKDNVLCGKPPDVDHGQWTDCVRVIGSNCSLTCDPDYELIGDPHITCQPNGRYTDPGICQRTILCGEPPDIRNGHWTECQRAIGSNCSLTCDPDYELIGDPHITCQPNGRYTGPGICQRIVSCGEPPTVNHGIWKKCERAIGSTCSLTCESNYELIGDSQVTCKTNGQYTGPGICKRIASCGDPPYVKNGHWTECQRVIWSRVSRQSVQLFPKSSYPFCLDRALSRLLWGFN